MVFDGNGFAKRIEDKLRKSGKLMGKKLVIFQTGKVESTYVRLKREMGERLKVNIKLQISNNKLDLKQGIADAGEDCDGVLVQLPIVGASTEERDEILRMIPPEKDVDGLNPDGGKFLPAAVVAVERILSRVQPVMRVEPVIGVVGAKGMVGKALVKRFRGLGYKVTGIDKKNTKKVTPWRGESGKLKECGVVVSATGQAGLIKPEMVKNGVVAIDLGYPKGDFDEKVKEKASFFTPVPGGVGPVTVVSLFENLSQT